MATLAQLSNINSPSGRGNEALALLLSRSPLLKFFEANSAWEEDSTNFHYQVATSGSSVKTRTIGANFSRSTVAPSDPLNNVLAVCGDAVQIDVSHLADEKRGLGTTAKFLEKELTRRIIGYANAFERIIMKGDPDDDEMKGFINILDGVTDVPGFTGSKRVIDAADYGAGNSFNLKNLTDTQVAKFLEMLQFAISEVENPTGIVCNRSLAFRINTIARRKNVSGVVAGAFGEQYNTFNNLPIIVANDTAITNDEPDDTGTPVEETTSLYIMSPAEMNLSIVTNSGLEWIDYDAQEAAEKNLEKWEIRSQIKIENDKSIIRVRNLKV